MPFVSDQIGPAQVKAEHMGSTAKQSVMESKTATPYVTGPLVGNPNANVHGAVGDGRVFSTMPPLTTSETGSEGVLVVLEGSGSSFGIDSGNGYVLGSGFSEKCVVRLTDSQDDIILSPSGKETWGVFAADSTSTPTFLKLYFFEGEAGASSATKVSVTGGYRPWYHRVYNLYNVPPSVFSGSWKATLDSGTGGAGSGGGGGGGSPAPVGAGSAAPVVLRPERVGKPARDQLFYAHTIYARDDSDLYYAATAPKRVELETTRLP